MWLYGRPTPWAHLTNPNWSRSAVHIVIRTVDKEGQRISFSTGDPYESTDVCISQRLRSIFRYHGMIRNSEFLRLHNCPWKNDKWKVTGTTRSYQIFVSNDGSNDLLTVCGTVNGRMARFLIDSGASDNFISQSFVEKQGFPITYNAGSGEVNLANGQSITVGGTVNVLIKMELYRKMICCKAIPLHVKYHVVLGQTWLKEENPVIN